MHPAGVWVSYNLTSPLVYSYYLAFRSAWGKYLLYLVLTVHMALALFEEPTLRPLQVNYLVRSRTEGGCGKGRGQDVPEFT